MSKNKELAQSLREIARKFYEASLKQAELEAELTKAKAYNIYCDSLDRANDYEGKPKVKR